MDSSQQVSSVHPPRNKLILVAENDESNRLLVKQILSFAGYACLLTSNGREALEALERERVDLALIDLSMPVLDGYRTAELIRRRPECTRLPLVAVTAHAMGADRDLALQRGFNEYLTKPFSSRTLLALVARLLGEAPS